MTAIAMSAAVAQPRDSASLLDWIAVIAASIGCFMALLDISIVNTALPTIQGEIGASGTEGTWVTTSYIVAESVAIPLTGWMVRIFGLRGVMIGSIVMFTAFSVFCGLAHNLTMMIIGRTMQGLSGGFLLPIVMMVIADRLPVRLQATGFALFGATAVVGPVVGPLLGGWLTEALSWHYAFFINLPVGVILIGLVLVSLPRTPMRPRELFEADWLGVAGLAIGLGCLTVVLEEGQRKQWFESAEIIWLSLATVVGILLLFAGQLTARRPVLRLSMMLRWRFGLIMGLSVVGGAAFYAACFLVPQFLGLVAQYNAFEAGKVLMISALISVGLMALIPVMVKHIPCRLIITFGLLLLAASCWVNSWITDESGADAFVTTQILHGIGTTAAMTFLGQLAVAIVPTDEQGDASAMFNAARNLGGTFGLSLVAILQDQRMTFHSQRILETVSANAQAAQDHLRDLAGIGGGDEVALRLFEAAIGRQALVMTYIDMFVFFGAMLLIVAPFALLLPPLPREEMAPAH